MLGGVGMGDPCRLPLVKSTSLNDISDQDDLWRWCDKTPSRREKKVQLKSNNLSIYILIIKKKKGP